MQVFISRVNKQHNTSFRWGRRRVTTRKSFFPKFECDLGKVKRLIKDRTLLDQITSWWRFLARSM